MNAGFKEEEKTRDISKEKKPFFSSRFKWKLSQVKHKVNQMNLMPRVFQSAAVTRLTRLRARGPEAPDGLNALNRSKQKAAKWEKMYRTQREKLGKVCEKVDVATDRSLEESFTLIAVCVKCVFLLNDRIRCELHVKVHFYHFLTLKFNKMLLNQTPLLSALIVKMILKNQYKKCPM